MPPFIQQEIPSQNFAQTVAILLAKGHVSTRVQVVAEQRFFKTFWDCGAMFSAPLYDAARSVWFLFNPKSPLQKPIHLFQIPPKVLALLGERFGFARFAANAGSNMERANQINFML